MGDQLDWMSDGFAFDPSRPLFINERTGYSTHSHYYARAPTMTDPFGRLTEKGLTTIKGLFLRWYLKARRALRERHPRVKRFRQRQLQRSWGLSFVTGWAFGQDPNFWGQGAGPFPIHGWLEGTMPGHAGRTTYYGGSQTLSNYGLGTAWGDPTNPN